MLGSEAVVLLAGHVGGRLDLLRELTHRPQDLAPRLVHSAEELGAEQLVLPRALCRLSRPHLPPAIVRILEGAPVVPHLLGELDQRRGHLVHVEDLRRTVPVAVLLGGLGRLLDDSVIPTSVRHGLSLGPASTGCSSSGLSTKWGSAFIAADTASPRVLCAAP